MLKIKEEFLDIQVSCPFTSRIVYLRFLDEALYKPYFDKGYQNIFENIDTKPYSELIFIEQNTEQQNVIPQNGTE